jgi:hypothetical protein
MVRDQRENPGRCDQNFQRPTLRSHSNWSTLFTPSSSSQYRFSKIAENFADCWTQLLRHIELAAMADNAEMSLAALKNLQELLFGRQQQTESSERRGNRTTGGQTK